MQIQLSFEPLGRMEARVSERPLYQIPKSRVAQIESKLKSGDIIGIVSRDRPGFIRLRMSAWPTEPTMGCCISCTLPLRSNYGKVRRRRAAFELSRALSERHWNSGRATAPLVSPRSPSSRGPLSRDEQSPFPHPARTLRASRRRRNPDSRALLRAGLGLRSDPTA